MERPSVRINALTGGLLLGSIALGTAACDRVTDDCGVVIEDPDTRKNRYAGTTKTLELNDQNFLVTLGTEPDHSSSGAYHRMINMYGGGEWFIDYEIDNDLPIEVRVANQEFIISDADKGLRIDCN